MLLTEVIVGKKTGDKALAAALDFVRAIRKTPIVVNDTRGFYANRCVLNYIQEGHLMLLEGIPAAMIENTARMAGMPVGPLSLNDETALDLGLKIVRAAEADLGTDAINPAQKKLLEDMVEKHGRLRPQERQGFLRLCAGQAEAVVAGTTGPAAEKTRARGSRGNRRRGTQAAVSRHSGGRGCAHASRRMSSPTCVKRMSVRSSASGFAPYSRRHAVLHRHDGHEEVRRALSAARQEIRAALRAAEIAARHGSQGRELLHAVCTAAAKGCLTLKQLCHLT